MKSVLISKYLENSSGFFKTKSRANRKDWFSVFIINFLLINVLHFMTLHFSYNSHNLLLGLMLATLKLLFVLYCCFSILVCNVRRLHDLGYSGWLVLLFIIPLWSLAIIFRKGNEGNNKYGAQRINEPFSILDYILILVIIACIFAINIDLTL